MSYPEDFDDLLCDTKAEFMQLAPKIQVAYCLHRLEAEVNNGGFHQFFSNSTGEYVTETIHALAEIGALKTVELLERAVSIGFPAGYPNDASQYESAVTDFAAAVDELDALDQEFFKYADPLTELVNEYLAKSI
jgi:glutathionyl-hydroquinone reductase